MVNQKVILSRKSLFQNNTASLNAGIYINSHSIVTFGINSDTTFIQNSAASFGGAIVNFESTISFADYSTAVFTNNNATVGRAIYCKEGNIYFEDNSTTVFNSNNACGHGGAIYCIKGNIHFEDNSTTVFNNNNALKGGAICSNYGSTISLEDNSITMFKNNIASNMSFEDNSTAVFCNNNASEGGAIHSNYHCAISFKDNSTTLFISNNTEMGGATYSNNNSTMTFEDNGTAVFRNNIADKRGGAMYSGLISFKDNSTAVFNYNDASVGGGIYSDDGSTTTFKDNSTIMFNNNHAINERAAIYSYDCNILSENLYSLVFSNNTSANNGTADAFRSYTFPSKLELYEPTIYIDDKEKKECDKYYINHVMLDQEIIIPACAADYCNHSVNSKVFHLHGEGDNYSISNSRILLSCGFISTSIRGYPPLSKPLNYSINIQSNNDHNSRWKQISVTLTVELLPCYHRFWQYPGSEKCECYNDENDIVFCSGSSSTIKKGYWFGTMGEKPTVTF